MGVFFGVAACEWGRGKESGTATFSRPAIFREKIRAPMPKLGKSPRQMRFSGLSEREKRLLQRHQSLANGVMGEFDGVVQVELEHDFLPARAMDFTVLPIRSAISSVAQPWAIS